MHGLSKHWWAYDMEEVALDYKWFIIHTHSGFEAKVIESIKEEVK